MVFLSPRPAERESGLFYQHKQYLPFASLSEKGSVTDLIYRVVRRLNLRWKRRLIDGYWRGEKAARPGRLLDVGCGTGEFLVAMKRAGWQVEGLERDASASAWARRTWGIPIHTGDVRDLPASSGPYDIITLWHVLEHLYDPTHVIGLLRSRLTSQGLLLIATPNVAGFDSRVYKENWIALDVPRHVNHFSAHSLKKLFGELGLESNSTRQLPMDALFNTLMSEQLAARRAQSGFMFFPLRLVRAGIVSMVSLVGGSWLFSARHGATLVCTFQQSDDKVEKAKVGAG